MKTIKEGVKIKLWNEYDPQALKKRLLLTRFTLGRAVVVNTQLAPNVNQPQLQMVLPAR